MKYHMNQDSLGDTADFQARCFAIAVQKALPEVEIVLCADGRLESNSEEAENLCESEVSRIWDGMEWCRASIGADSVTIDRNSQGGWTVRWPSAEHPGFSLEKHFTPAIGYPCRAEAVSFAKDRKNEMTV